MKWTKPACSISLVSTLRWIPIFNASKQINQRFSSISLNKKLYQSNSDGKWSVPLTINCYFTFAFACVYQLSGDLRLTCTTPDHLWRFSSKIDMRAYRTVVYVRDNDFSPLPMIFSVALQYNRRNYTCQ